jgi:hypothetical protein
VGGCKGQQLGQQEGCAAPESVCAPLPSCQAVLARVMKWLACLPAFHPHNKQTPDRPPPSLRATPQIQIVLESLKADWPGASYDLLTRNCCHFCEDMAARLGVGPVPGWLNRFAQGADATLQFTNEAVTLVGGWVGGWVGVLFARPGRRPRPSEGSQQGEKQLSERSSRRGCGRLGRGLGYVYVEAGCGTGAAAADGDTKADGAVVLYTCLWHQVSRNH